MAYTFIIINMNRRLIGPLICLAGLIIATIETTYFGCNLTPGGLAEVAWDMISATIFILGVILIKFK